MKKHVIIENVPVSEINSDTSVAELSQFDFSPDAIKTPNINPEVSDDSLNVQVDSL